MSTSHLPESVTLDLWAPLTSQALPDHWPALLDGWMRGNQILLSGLDAIETGASEHELDSASASQIERVEAKLNLTLHLIGSLLAQQQPMATPRAVRFSAHGAEWLAHEQYARGTQLLLSIGLSEQVPQPLILPAEVVHIEASAAGGWLITVLFQHLSEAVANGLGRSVFRRHRRAIQARHSGQR